MKRGAFLVHIQYRVEVKGIFKNLPLYINSFNNEIKTVEVLFEKTESNFDILFVKFYFNKNIDNLQKAEALTKPVLTNFINLLIYKFKVIFKEPLIHSYNVLEKTMMARGSITIYNQPFHEITEGDSKWLSEEIQNYSLLNRLKNNPYFLQYKSIIAVEDNVSRFLLLYGLLFEIKSTQKAVDKFIESEEINVIKRRTTKIDSNTKKRLTYKETIYTWWRNQAQHMQKNTNINEVTKQFNLLEGALKDLVFKAIKSQM